MPPRKSPSAIYIQMHQLANEKERLHQELAMLCDRQLQIMQRLGELDRGLAKLESDVAENTLNVDFFTDATPTVKAQKTRQVKTVRSSSGNPFDSMTIEY
ncbi:hypothetical protein V2H45_18205 [Tumidithrix elongata RA019]|uniref:Gas vesicle protein n=1 Tax=Tumidithrix elongata BACA0141 TaxID=2716417 RepID=A0AAW9Q6X4_9CYAN|nr:hypothetical protein [Tumidithrix elongata RA019]